MKNPLIILLFLLAYTSSLTAATESNNQPIRMDDSTDVLEVRLDKTQVTLPCPKGCKSRSGECPYLTPIRIHAVIVGAKTEFAGFRYSVSQGRIIGAGSDVEWDLSAATQGTYKLVVKANRGMSKTVYLKVVECPDCICDYFCPSIQVMGPNRTVEAGETLVFTASISGGPDQIVYRWKVSGGKIISGQGTPSVEVKTKRKKIAGKVTATIEIKNHELLVHYCTQTAAESAIVQPSKP